MVSSNKSHDNILLPTIDEMKELLLETSPSSSIIDWDHHGTLKTEEMISATQQRMSSQLRFHGAIIGALTQIINISGTAVIAYQWGPDADLFAEHASWGEQPLHLLVYVISQTDLLLSVSMWLGLTAALTERGLQWWKKLLGDSSSVSDRSTFITVVHFYIGVVFGSFLACCSLDFALGLPAPVYSLISVFLVGLSISYYMDQQ